MVWTARRVEIGSNSARSDVLAAIVIFAVVSRVGSALWQGNCVTDLPGIYDQLSYHELAQRVGGGYGFSFAEGHWPATRAGEPTAHWSYLYTLYLAAVYVLCGVQPVAARVLQAIIAGALHPWLAWRLGRRVFGSAAGTLAAAFSAVYIYFIYYAGGLVTESFYFVGILWTFDAALRVLALGPRPVPRRVWLELGLAIGITGLLRQLFLLFVPFLFLWLWLNLPEGPTSRHGRFARALRCSTLKGMSLAFVVVMILVLPWSARNYRAFGTFVPLNTNAGFAFYWGNHPIHGTRFIPLLPVTGPSYADLIPSHLLVLNEGELDRALLKEGMRIVAADPGRFVQLSMSRVPEYFRFWPSGESSAISNVSRVGSFGVFLPFVLYGLWVSAALARAPHTANQRPSIVLLYVFIVVYTAVHLASWTLIRYRLPLDAVLLVFAAVAVSDIVSRVRNRQRSALRHERQQAMPTHLA